MQNVGQATEVCGGCWALTTSPSSTCYSQKQDEFHVPEERTPIQKALLKKGTDLCKLLHFARGCFPCHVCGVCEGPGAALTRSLFAKHLGNWATFDLLFGSVFCCYGTSGSYCHLLWWFVFICYQDWAESRQSICVWETDSLRQEKDTFPSTPGKQNQNQSSNPATFETFLNSLVPSQLLHKALLCLLEVEVLEYQTLHESSCVLKILHPLFVLRVPNLSLDNQTPPLNSQPRI